MSYFIAGFSDHFNNIQTFHKIFESIIPDPIKQNKFFFENKNTFFRTYGHQKAINDIFYFDQATGSWIAIMGTPLFIIDYKNNQGEILKSFFSSPDYFIKNIIDGCWALVAYDAVNDQIFACTDYDNTVPIYYAIKNSTIYLSSHELPLAKFINSPIDPIGFTMTIHLKLTWDTYTRFVDIKKLLPATMMTIKNSGQIYIKTYWKPEEENQFDISFNQIIEYFISILKNAISLFYKHSNKEIVACDITGGEDSRLILAAIHNLHIPFFTVVDGNKNDIDVLIANKIARAGGFKLVVRPKPSFDEKNIIEDMINAILFVDGYEDLFPSFHIYALNSSEPNMNYQYVKYGGAPGGEVFRGSYYLRGALFFPTILKSINYDFFTRMKFLLDFKPGLLNFPDDEVIMLILRLVQKTIQDISDFPAGIKIDHLLRTFQTCNTGLIYKSPRYLPFASKNLTKSIYNILPKFKRGGRLTKACTELLYPEISHIKTQKGVPTIRKNILSLYKFIPEYKWTSELIISGICSRLLKFKDSSKPALAWNKNANSIKFILTKSPFSSWFASHKSMITGELYKHDSLYRLLKIAKDGKTYHIATLGRIISQEIAARWVYDEL